MTRLTGLVYMRPYSQDCMDEVISIIMKKQRVIMEVPIKRTEGFLKLIAQQEQIKEHE